MPNLNGEFVDWDESQRELRLAERELFRQTIEEKQKKLEQLEKWVNLLKERAKRQARVIRKSGFSTGRKVNFNSTIGG